jgi:hypothetical protein
MNNNNISISKRNSIGPIGEYLSRTPDLTVGGYHRGQNTMHSLHFDDVNGPWNGGHKV